MGMNTNDIRNMNSNQNLFWAVAIPVTVFVFTAAFIYGYKGEALAEAVEQWLPAKDTQQEAAKLNSISRQQTWLSGHSGHTPEDTEKMSLAKRPLLQYIRRRKAINSARDDRPGV